MSYICSPARSFIQLTRAGAGGGFPSGSRGAHPQSEGEDVTVGELVRARRERHGDQPLLTYYDAATGERTELGYATFENWTAKTANAIADHDVEPGEEVVVAVDGHWAGLVAVLACGLVGCRAMTLTGPPPSDHRAALSITHERYAAAVAGGPRLLVGEGLGGRLTEGGDDGFVDEVLACDDVYDDPAVDADDDWLVLDRGVWSQGEAIREAPVPPARRVLLSEGLESATLAAVGVIVAGASMVTVRGGDERGRARVAEQERCEATL